MVNTMAKALLFPSALEALGDIGYGLSSEVWWSPSHPFTSSLTGQTCQELADAYESAHGQAVDAADHALRGLRGRRRRAQAHHERGRQAGHRRRRQGDRHRDDRRPHHVDGGRATQPRQQRVRHRAHGRSVEQGRRSIPSTSTSSTASGPRRSSAWTSRPRRSSRPSRTESELPASRPPKTAPMALGVPPVGRGEKQRGAGLASAPSHASPALTPRGRGVPLVRDALALRARDLSEKGQQRCSSTQRRSRRSSALITFLEDAGSARLLR